MSYREFTFFKLGNDCIIYEISYIGFHDRFNINFYSVSIDDTDLNNILASLFDKLLLLNEIYNYFMGEFKREMLKFEISLDIKLLLYSRYRVSQFLGN